MLQALHAAGVVPDFVVGASVGAINAVMYAAKPDADGLETLARLWCGLRRRDVFPISLARAAWSLTGRIGHWVAPAPLRELIVSALVEQRLELTRVPAYVLATDALDGTTVVMSTGNTSDALMASSAIPAVFPSVAVDGRRLIDGSFATETPIACAVRLGATRLIVLPTGTPCALREPPRGALASALHAINLLSMRQLLVDIEHCAERCNLSVVPPLCPMAVGPYDFSHAAQLMDRAEESTRQWLAKGATGTDPRWALLPHRHAPAAQAPPSVLFGRGAQVSQRTHP
jgi:NTE family protein